MTTTKSKTSANDKTSSSEKETNTADVPGFSPETLNVPYELEHAQRPDSQWDLAGDYAIATHEGRDAFWVVMRREGKGGLALRTFPIMGHYDVVRRKTTESGGEWRIETNSGVYDITLEILGDSLIRMTSRLTPSHDLLVVFWPRDLYVLDAHDDPRKAKGRVEAGQRGLNAGVCYFCLSKPLFGTVLYMQNLSAINDFFDDSKTKPDGVVGGQWPELGYQPPASPEGYSPPQNPLKKGKTYVISDALISIRETCDSNEFESARNFIEMLAGIYPYLDKPEPVIRDWLWRAEKTLLDLKTSPDVCEEHFKKKYLRPYTASEVPDSMVQMTVLSSLREYEWWRGEKDPLSDELAEGMELFFDREVRSLRRYLPDVGADKDRDAVDSWYLYHPLMNLARLAIRGEDWADTLFRKSVAHATKAAQHFKYKWPIQYSLKDWTVITPDRGDGLGQTDVGGFYAYVILLAYELTTDRTYVEEAKLALKALEDYRFELVYQTNLTAWGFVACLKLWRMENDEHYRDQACVFLAGLMHNCELWQSKIGLAAKYANFFGMTCLHDGPYMAAYEAFETFSAFDEAVRVAGDGMPDAMRLLVCEYRKYALDVLWSFYPDVFAPDELAQEIRNGHIDRALSMPLEDVYGDGSPPGQVGQEVYGAGAAFVVVSRACFTCGNAPFRLFAEYPVTVEAGEDEVRLTFIGPKGYEGRIRLLPKGAQLPKLTVRGEDGTPIKGTTGEGFVEYRLPADGSFTVRWNDEPN